MRYGFVLPYGDARTVADTALLCEQHGWDAFFTWEPVWGVDAWVSLAAAAMVTSTIRLGTMLTPLARMKPWKLASETATLDNLSGGRVILAVGLGGAPGTGYESFGEELDRRVRAELTDEGLDILTGLWAGQPFSYRGKHYTVDPCDFLPPAPPVQQPRIPIWVVGAWGRPKSMRRALRYDGLLPYLQGPDGVTPQEVTPHHVAQMRARADASRPADAGPYDIVVEVESPADPVAAQELAASYADAGATWWIESPWGITGDDAAEKLRARIVAGPPR